MSFEDRREGIYSGLIVGGILWSAYSFALLLKSSYSNWFINRMNPAFNVTLYSYSQWEYILFSLVVFIVLGAFFGWIFYLLKPLVFDR